MASGRLFQRREAANVVCIVEPPAGERPRSVAHGSVRNDLVGRLCTYDAARLRNVNSNNLYSIRIKLLLLLLMWAD